MPREIEQRFYEYNKEQLMDHLSKIRGFKQIHGPKVFSYVVYDHPTEPENNYIRVRDECIKTTLTVKTDLTDKYVNEYEVTVSDFEMMNIIMDKLGLQRRYTIEKLREIYIIGDDIEIVFDTYPLLPEYMEIECKNEKTLDKIKGELSGIIKDEPEPLKQAGDMYYELYGIPKPESGPGAGTGAGTGRRAGDLTFATALQMFDKYIIKNKDVAKKMHKIHNKLVKSSKQAM